jgi:hypothetical protein
MGEPALGAHPRILGLRRSSVRSVIASVAAILVGIVPEIAAFAHLAVAARAVFMAEGDGRLTFVPLGGD